MKRVFNVFNIKKKFSKKRNDAVMNINDKKINNKNNINNNNNNKNNTDKHIIVNSTLISNKIITTTTTTTTAATTVNYDSITNKICSSIPDKDDNSNHNSTYNKFIIDNIDPTLNKSTIND